MVVFQSYVSLPEGIVFCNGRIAPRAGVAARAIFGVPRVGTAAGSSVVLRQFDLTLRLMQHSQDATDFRVTCCHRRPLEETRAGNWLLHSLPAVPKAQLCTPEFVAMQLCFFKPSKAKRRGGELKALHKEALSRGVGTERPWSPIQTEGTPSPCVAGPFSWCTGGTRLVSARFRKQPTCLILFHACVQISLRHRVSLEVTQGCW